MSVTQFTRADARAAGITAELISSRYQKVFYNLYVSADVVFTPQLRAKAALRLASHDSYAGHHTAAELWGLPVATTTTRTLRCRHMASGYVARA
jgi:hypothetical protein